MQHNQSDNVPTGQGTMPPTPAPMLLQYLVMHLGHQSWCFNTKQQQDSYLGYATKGDPAIKCGNHPMKESAMQQLYEEAMDKESRGFMQI